jgi:hypothetical protein
MSPHGRGPSAPTSAFRSNRRLLSHFILFRPCQGNDVYKAQGVALGLLGVPRWGGMTWGGMTQGSVTFHPGPFPCAALRPGARDRVALATRGSLERRLWNPRE